MMDNYTDNIMSFGPGVAFLWILTITFSVWRPQKYFNSILLMTSLLVTMLFLSGFFGDYGRGYFLIACFILVTTALLLVPGMLIMNGVVMIRRESVCPAHLLSLILGLIIGIGELAALIYVLGLFYSTGLENLNLFILFIASTVFYFSCLVLSFVIYSLFIQHMPHLMNFNYVIIHGAGLAGGERLTKLLANRVDKAIGIYKKCRVKPYIIPSGGKGDDEKISEAEAMKKYLLDKGIPEESIILEDTSATTEENLINSKVIIDSREGKKKTALVSSSYHIYRCLKLAKKAGIKCTGIGAEVAAYYWPSALIREFIAVFLTKGFMFWAILGYLAFISPLVFVFCQSLT